VSREEQLRAAWYEAHQELRDFLEPYTHTDRARVIATTACALWMRKALDGYVSVTGPYGLLYVAAYEVATHAVGSTDLPEISEAEKRVPINKTLLPYQLSKIYVDCWKAGQLLSWDRKTANRATRALSLIWPVTSEGWATIGPDEINPLAVPLARRAVETLNHHECLDCSICTEAALRWEEADHATEEWFTGRRLTKEEGECPTEERSPSQ